MSDRSAARRTLLAGFLIAVCGVLCVGGGIGVLAWRLARPEQSARLLPPGLIVTPQPTPTPGVLGTPIAPPPLPANLMGVAILPESKDPTPTPTAYTLAPTFTQTQTVLPSAQSPTAALVTSTFAPPMSATSMPTVTYTRTPTPEPSPTVTAATATSSPPSPTPFAPIPERILIRRIGLEAPVVPVGLGAIEIEGEVFSQWAVPRERAAGWHESSARIGQAGNLVLNGHHNIYGEVFRYLTVLEPGDLITLEGGGRRTHYVVVQTMTLAEQDQPAAARQANARWILPTADERVTLVTCWPYYANTHRLVVIARPLEAVIPPPDIP